MLLPEVIDIYEKYISRISPFLDVEALKKERILCLEDMATEGQRRRLLCLHNALLEAIFNSFAAQLLTSDNDPTNQNVLTPSTDLTIQSVASKTLVRVVTNFDRNFRALRRDRRIWQLPKAWANIIAARAQLSLALARACLASSHCATTSPLTRVVSTDAKAEKVAHARRHLSDARYLENWLYYRFRAECTQNGKLMPWILYFFPLLEVIGNAVGDYEHGATYYAMYHQPMFYTPCKLKLRWDYQFIDMNVPYDFTLH